MLFFKYMIYLKFVKFLKIIFKKVFIRMKITMLGTRGEIEESALYHSKHSGVLIDDMLLLDCGEESFLKYKPKAILITHLHPDHAFFVRRGYAFDFELLKDIDWYAPETYKDQGIVLKKSIVIAGYTITPIPTLHSLHVKSQAYSIQKNGKKIIYTGDMLWIEHQYHHLLTHTDLVITEASYIRTGGLVIKDKVTGVLYGHTGIPNLIALFKKDTQKILLGHFGAWFYKDMKKAHKKLQDLAHENGIEIIVGYDGLEVKL